MAPLIPVAVSLIAEVIPELVSIFGTKKQAEVAGKVLDIAKQVTGAENSDYAAKAIAADPSLSLKFKEAVLSQKTEIERIGYEREKMYVADADSARKMQIAALQQEDVFSKRFVYWFAAAWSAFAMLFMSFAMMGTIPENNQRNVDMMLTFLLGTVVAGIFGFFMGTTFRSQKKDDTIKALTEK